MDILHVEWNAKIVDTIISKHNVFPTEVEQIFQGKTKVKSHRGVYVALGKSSNGRFLLVVFRKKKEHHIKIITARSMTKSEKRLYRR